MGGSLSTHAQWSTPRQLRKAGLFADEGLILGRVGRRLLRHNGPAHLLLVAGTRKGKSTCFVLPNLLTWRESFLVVDPKDELHPLSAGWRSTFSRVVRLSPTSSLSQRYNVLDAIPIGEEGEIRAAQMIAEGITDVEQKGTDHMSDTGRHFTGLAAEGFVGLVLYGLYTQRARSLGALDSLLVSTDIDRLLKTMHDYPHPAIHRAAWALRQAGPQGEKGGILTTLSRALRLYTDPLIARATDTSDFTLRDLRERARPLSLYLTIPPSDRERVKPWTRIVVRQLLDYATQHLEGWRWKLAVLLDEFPLLDRITAVSDGLTYAAGYGVRFLLVTASMEQVIRTFQQHHPFFDGCEIKIAFSVDDAAARTFSQRVGETEVEKKHKIGRNWSTEKVKEPLLSPTALMNLPSEQALVVVGQHKVLATKTYYKNNAVWAARSTM